MTNDSTAQVTFNEAEAQAALNETQKEEVFVPEEQGTGELDWESLNYVAPAVSAKIQRKRDFEKARRERIFNAKTRTIGVDKEALDQGVADRAAAATAAKRADAAIDAEALEVVTQMNLIELERQRLYTEAKKGVVAFNDAHGAPEHRREWYLSDPRRLQKDEPTRKGDYDDRLGASSIQVFEGEDLNKKENDRVKKATQKSWIAEQIQLQHQIHEHDGDEDRDFAQNQKVVCELRVQLEAEEMRLRKNMTIGALNVNEPARLAQEANKMQYAHKKKSAEQNAAEYAEMEFIRYKDTFLNEAGVQMNPNGSIRRDHFRGFSQDQIVDNAAQVVAQREHDDAIKAAAKSQEAHDDKQYDNTRKILVGMEMKRQQMYKEKVKESLAMNDELVKSQHMRRTAKDDGIDPTEYFKFFGSTTR